MLYSFFFFQCRRRRRRLPNPCSHSHLLSLFNLCLTFNRKSDLIRCVAWISGGLIIVHGFRSTCYYPEGEILPFFPLFDVNLFPIFEIFFLWQLTLTRVSNLYEVGGVAWVVAATNDEQGEKLSNPSTRFADSEKEIFPWKWSSAWILLLFLWFCCCFHCSRLL